MSDFITAFNGCLGAATHERIVQKELAGTKDATLEAKNRATGSESNVKLLDTSLPSHKKDVSRLTTDLVASKARISEFERDATTSNTNLFTPRSATQKASPAVFDLDG